MAVLLGATCIGLAATLAPSPPAFADGPAPCSVGGPPFPFAGFCATYSGANTWYGTYGPGFPTDEGWGFCADPPASGGDYPAPDYDYTPSGPPPGASTGQASALGFAFSEAEALGWWGGSPGQFTSDQAAVAGKLLYDAVIWAEPVPAMDPGVLAAYQALDGWYLQAVGASSAPSLTSELAGSGTAFTGSSDFQIQAVFPDTGNSLVGIPVQVSISGGTLETVGGPTSETVSTDPSGTTEIPIFASAPGSVSVTLTVPGGLGQMGMSFFEPTAKELGAQQLAAFAAPSTFTTTEQLTALPTTGTVSVVKGGDDTAYYPLGGAVFQVLSGNTVSATLTTGTDGTSSVSGPLPAGSYTVHEETPPPGYGASPDQTVTVVAGSNTVASFTGADEDHVVPASLAIRKTDDQSGAPLAGAVFTVRYDPLNDGGFPQLVGTCTTSASGSCSPPGDDGSAELLPGRYQVTESTPPPGYSATPPTSQVVELLAGENGTVVFGDAELVAVVFHKTASGNINPTELSLAGAVFDVDEGSPSGTEVASCSSDASGTCMTQPVLLSGGRYCWVERTPPTGLAGGASGCFTADNDQANQPIPVDDQGEFVTIGVKKVDAAAPSVGLPGAVFDLVRLPGGAENSSAEPFPPTNATLVATVTTGPGGIGTFPLQLPGYQYCAVEIQAPPNYEGDPDPQCTAVLSGSTTIPPTVTMLTFSDTEETIGLSVFKYNSTTPNTGIPGAVYDLYVQGAPPPSGIPETPPANVTSEGGDTWYSRGTTGSDGRLSFTVPAGYSWCVLEVSAPLDYVLDRALHCSAVLTSTSSSEATTIAVPESVATVHVTAYKYNSEQPNTVIPDATYELLVAGAAPPGASEAVPAGAAVPKGDTYWAQGTTDVNGVLDFAVPAGHSWCLHELVAPAAYQEDPAYHCTAILTTDTTAAAATVAVPEMPASGSLAFTGTDSLWLGVAGAGFASLGAGTVLFGRRRKNSRANR